MWQLKYFLVCGLVYCKEGKVLGSFELATAGEIYADLAAIKKRIWDKDENIGNVSFTIVQEINLIQYSYLTKIFSEREN